MIPIRDENPTSTFPFFTIAIVVINVASYVLFNLMLPKEDFTTFVYCGGVVPSRLFRFTGPAEARTVVTSMFIHANILHLAGNMLFLWIFGNNVEDKFGHIRFIVFYFLAGVVSVALHSLMNQASTLPLIGASGAIAGVLGAYFVLFPRAQVLVVVPIFIFIQFIWLPAAVVLGFWFVLQVVLGYVDILRGEGAGGVAWLAHVGGFAAGLLFVKPFERSRKKRKSDAS